MGQDSGEVTPGFSQGLAKWLFPDDWGQGQGVPRITVGISPDAAQDRGDAGHRFEAPQVAAGASHTIRDDLDVADLAGCGVLTAMEPRAKHEAGADASPQLYQHHVLAGTRMSAELGEGCDLSVVCD
jgi:hypothetical protein